jgi:uncharacterized protein (TIGR00369 family)
MPASKQQIIDFLNESFPQANCQVDSVGDQQAVVSHHIGEDELRPGGTVSGPVLMKVADVALYVAILGEIGIVPLAVTTNLNVSFLRKPSAEARIIAKCQLIKVGRSLAVGEVYLYSEGNDKPVAHAVGTYALPH